MLARHRLREVSPSLHALLPRSLPFGSLDKARTVGARLYAADVQGACHDLGFRNPLYWLFDDRVDRLELLEPAAYVYHVLDLYRHTPQEEQVAKGAAVVFTVSPLLQERYKQFHDRCYLLPNGVEIRWFRPVDRTSYQRPSDMPPLARRVVGYTGPINRHINLALLVAVARALPEVLVVLIGPRLRGYHGPQGEQREALQNLRKLPNIRLLGAHPVWKLPGYLQAFDVCLLPALPDEWSMHSDPLKFLQYLAMGKPVVTNKINDLRVPDDIYLVGESTNAFVEQTRKALDEPSSPELIERRIGAAMTRDWASLIEQGLKVLENAGCRIKSAVVGSSSTP